MAVCYDPNWRLSECDYDCDFDYDCGPGLWCSDEHKQELEDFGYDGTKANCGNVGDDGDEVCFSPNLFTF